MWRKKKNPLFLLLIAFFGTTLLSPSHAEEIEGLNQAVAHPCKKKVLISVVECTAEQTVCNGDAKGAETCESANKKCEKALRTEDTCFHQVDKYSLP